MISAIKHCVRPHTVMTKSVGAPENLPKNDIFLNFNFKII